jgi:cytochrome c2
MLAIQWCPAKGLAGSSGRLGQPRRGYAAAPGLPAQGCRVWTEAAPGAYLRSPEELAPGTAMTSVGLSGPGADADVIGGLAAAGNGRVEE